MRHTDDYYMRRAVELARKGLLHTSPNPMVGAVIVAPDGRIIGEGWHRRCGEGHAEVNAVAAVRDSDRHLLKSSAIYVTLEPCSHYGKTPPCASMLVREGFRRVVVAMTDPNPLVAGRGLTMLREAGIDVSVGVLATEAEALNPAFLVSQRRRRPRVTLKWAMSGDGMIDGRDGCRNHAAVISTPLSLVAVHRLRASHDAIAVGSGTYLADKPSLTVRHFAGDSPLKVLFDRSSRVGDLPDGWIRMAYAGLDEALETLKRDYNVASLLVEGGRQLLQSFIDSGLWDEARVEVNPGLMLSCKPFTTPAPNLGKIPYNTGCLDGNTILSYCNNEV